MSRILATTGCASARPPGRRLPAEASPAEGAFDTAEGRSCALAREVASAFLDVPMEEISRRSRSPAPTCRARHVAMYLAHVSMQVPLAAIARDFGRDRTSVAYAVRRIEDERDDAGFDALLTRLEKLAFVCRSLALGGSARPGDDEG